MIVEYIYHEVLIGLFVMTFIAVAVLFSISTWAF